MSRLVDVLMRCERTDKEVAIWQARADSLKAKGHLHDALGTNLGTRLVGLRRAAPAPRRAGSWRAASRAFARLEALLAGALVSRHGVRAPGRSPTSTISSSRSTAWRIAPQPQDEDAVPSTQPETTTMAFVSTTLPPDL